jgi:hypothetical protein
VTPPAPAPVAAAASATADAASAAVEAASGALPPLRLPPRPLRSNRFTDSAITKAAFGRLLFLVRRLQRSAIQSKPQPGPATPNSCGRTPHTPASAASASSGVLFSRLRCAATTWRRPRVQAVGEDLRRGVVAQVAVAPADACTQRVRVARCRQQREVVVAFEQQRMAACSCASRWAVLEPASVSTPRPPRAVAEARLQRLLRVVRHRVGRDLQVAEVDRLAVAREAQQAVRQLRLADRAPGAAAHPQRNAMAAGECDRAADMVAVLVGHEQRVDVVHA